MEFSISTLKDNPHLFEDLISLIEDSLGYSPANSFKIDFYPLVEINNWKNLHLLLDEDGSLVAHIGTRPTILKKGDFELKSLFLGGLCIQKNYRGKGHFKNFFKTILKKESSKYALLFLWSDLFSLYEKFNFFPSFGQLEFSNEEKPSAFYKTTIDELSTKDIEEIKYLYDVSFKNCYSPYRTNQDWENLFKINSAQLFISRSNNKIDQYYIKNKGEDLGNIVYEYGGKKIEHTLKSIPESKIWAPEKLLNQNKGVLQYMGLVKVGNQNSFSEFILSWSHQKISILEINDSEISFQFEGKIHNLPIKDFLPVIFGPNPAEEFKDLGAPLFISGLDSI